MRRPADPDNPLSRTDSVNLALHRRNGPMPAAWFRRRAGLSSATGATSSPHNVPASSISWHVVRCWAEVQHPPLLQTSTRALGACNKPAVVLVKDPTGLEKVLIRANLAISVALA